MELKDIEELIQLLENSDASEITVRKGDWGVTVKKGHPPMRQGAPARAAEDQTYLEPSRSVEPGKPAEAYITAPMVGIFHALDQGPKEGDRIQPGQIVGVIESMKLMNDVRANVGGIVIAVTAEDGMPVEYGHPLFRMSPSSASPDEEVS